jgi:sugar phosphate isomerase/epimerase
MQSARIGVDLASLRQPFKQALLTAARLGVAAVEIDGRNELFARNLTGTAVRQLRKMLEDLNLRVCAVGFHTRRGYYVPDGLDARVAATKRMMQLAYQLGAPLVVNQVGQVPANADDPNWSLLIDVLGDLAKFGQHVGAVLAAETGTESGSDLRRLLEAIPSGFVAADLNPAKLITQGFAPREAVEQLRPWIRHVHATDGTRDMARGRGTEVPLGQGSADLPELIGALESDDYRGYFTVQCPAGDSRLEEIQQAVNYLKRL